MAGRSYKTEAVVLRSFRLGEADRVLHLYTEAHGRVGSTFFNICSGVLAALVRSQQDG